MTLSPDDAIRIASLKMRSGNLPGAIENLRDALTVDPEHALAHALLASVLLQQRRLHAARLESDLAIAAAPELDFGHRVRGYVAIADQDHRQANACFERAIELDPNDGGNFVALSRLFLVRDDLPGALAAATKALALDPGNGEALLQKARVLLRQQQIGEAEAAVREALHAEPEDVDALVLLGQARLRSGDPDAARDLALWALQRDATDEDALALLADVKLRQSWLLGLWWRYHVWISRLGAKNALLVLTLLYVVYYLLQQVLDDFGLQEYGGMLAILWLIFCVYSWAGGSIRDRMVAKELDSVRLKPEF